VERGGEVDGDDLVPLVVREILDGRDELNPGIVDEDVDRPEFALGLLDIPAISGPFDMSAGE
jgi:hypothetical protein